MAKKEMRVIVASGDVAGLVDHGCDVDTQIKNLGFEDKGIKTKITDAVGPQIDKSETSVRVAGTRALATVTAVESVELDPEAKRVSEVMAAVDGGLLDGMVDKKMVLSVDSKDAAQAKEILNKAGLRANVLVSVKVSAEGLRDAKAQAFGPPENAKALEALRESVKRDVTYRVKYEAAKG